ncbi:MAG: hypothetical protein ACTTIR_06050 [Eggerthia catenaformis]|uniref:hypothetical protein n=1 Tax=Eggerthia catenaformis TaxID=31973 RepID=UPI003FA1679F
MIKETIEKLNSIIEKSNNIELEEDIEEIIYNLEKSITLEDFLGWDEDQEYEYNNRIFKTRNNILYSRSMNESKFYETLLPISRLDDLRKASKFEPKKYYLKLKRDILVFLNADISMYLNYDKLKDKCYLDTKDEFLERYQTKFIKEEIENIKLPEYITLDMFEIIEME